MVEYIDKNKLMRYLEDERLSSYMPMMWRDGYDYAFEITKESEPEDVMPVVHGEWVGEWDGYYNGEPVIDMWYCSNCDYQVDDDEKPDWNFCPHCGADMRKEKKTKKKRKERG